MGEAKKPRPNEILRRERQRRGWSQQRVAEQLDTGLDMVSKWELGKSLPSPFYRERLCLLFGKNAEELGLIEQEFIKIPSNHSAHVSLTELLQPLVEHPQCAWVMAWGLGEEVSNIELVYDTTIHYEPTLTDGVQQVYSDWCNQNQAKYNEKKRDPVGAQVRLEKVEWSHNAYKYFILLSPSRYLNYIAVHPQLGNAQFRSLREAYIDNAFQGLKNGETLELPSNFALHMAVVSQDGYLLLRRRASNTELYPSVWEAGIGEFMHGPQSTSSLDHESGLSHSQFPHFTEDRHPDLYLFLKNAVAEELGYHEALQEDFRLYGFAVEYETLAPKLLVVYHANCAIATLLQSARSAKDRARELSSIALTPSALAEACSRAYYSSWGPTSKLIMLLALRQSFMNQGEESQSLEITALLDSFEPEMEMVSRTVDKT